MDNLLEIINDYYTLAGIFDISTWFYNSLDTDISIEDGLYCYFANFKSYDKTEFINFAISNGSYDDRENHIANELDIVTSIYHKYHINSIDELDELVIDVWNKDKFYSDDLLKEVLLIERIKRRYSNKIKFNESILKIYIDMVTSNMITDPNLSIGSSSERLYTMLPENESCYEYNLMIFKNRNIDWRIYRNGCNALGHFCFKYNESKTETEKKYYHDVILTALSSSCSLFNDIFIKNSFKDKDIINYYLVCETDTYRPQCKINDIAFSEEIKKFILTDKIFEHQLKLYKDINPVADEVIKRLNLSRNI